MASARRALARFRRERELDRQYGWQVPDMMKLASFIGSKAYTEKTSGEEWKILAVVALTVLQDRHANDPDKFIGMYFGPSAERSMETLTLDSFIQSCEQLVEAGYVPRWDSSVDSPEGLVVMLE